MKNNKYRRVLLKISGEALSGTKKCGIDSEEVKRIAGEILEIKKSGIEIAIVIGGGNIFRGAKEEKIINIDRVACDYIGMLATVINAIVLEEVFERHKIASIIQSSIEIPKFCEPYIRKNAVKYLKEGKVLILAGGTGNPYFTTDTTAALRAIELKADVFLKATNVDGVYTDDPKKNSSARKLSVLTFMEAIEKKLRVMDITAFSLCMENNLPVVVFNINKKGNILKAIKGEKIGTLVINK